MSVHRVRSHQALLIAVLAAAAVWAFLYPFVLNVPFSDDYSMFLGFVWSWFGTDDASERIRLLLFPHNEHVVLFARGMGLLTTYFFGALNFRILFLVGLVGIIALIFSMLMLWQQSNRQRFALLIPLAVAGLVTSPCAFEAFLWVTSALTNVWVYPFAFLAFWMCSSPRVLPLAIGCGFSALAFFTNGNGLLVFPCLIIMGMLQREYPLKRRMIFSLMLVMLCVLLLTLVRTQHLNGSWNINVGRALELPSSLVEYFFVFLGAPFAFQNVHVAVGAGTCVFAFVLLLLLRGFSRIPPALVAANLFCIGSVAANALTRSHNGAAAAMASRYQFCALMVVGVAVLTLDALLRNRDWWQKVGRVLIFSSSGLYVAFSYYSMLGGPSAFRAGIIYPTLLWAVNHESISPTYGSREEATAMLAGAKSLSAFGKPLYRMPLSEMTAVLYPKTTFEELPPQSVGIEFALDSFDETPDIISIFGWAWLPRFRSAGDDVFIVFEKCKVMRDVIEGEANCVAESGEVRAFKSERFARPDVDSHFSILTGQTLQLGKSGFAVRVAKDDLSPGVYQVSVLVRAAFLKRRGAVRRKLPRLLRIS